MNGYEYIELDFIVDKLTNSIENRFTKEVFDTDIFLLTSKDNKQKKGLGV